MTTLSGELARRHDLWARVSALDPYNAEPGTLHTLRVYGGAQGIWVDKKNTSPLSTDGQGVTVSILHTGRHYPDDLSDDGLIYHYPKTRRPPGRDAAEISATKNAADLSLPIFVILPSVSATRRSVRLGWVVDFDDENGQFLILFGSEKPSYKPAPDAEIPFALMGGAIPRRTTVKTRPNQQRFRFQVLAKYGCKCAVCEITHPSLMKAAHICGKAHDGSDDWRNGLPLCSTHHDAFDAHLFSICPETMAIEAFPGVSLSSIGIIVSALNPMHRRPHRDALAWRIARANRLWMTKSK